MAAKKKTTKKPIQKTNDMNVFWPVALILVGVLLLASNLGILPKQMMQYWPVLLVILGLVGLSGSL